MGYKELEFRDTTILGIKANAMRMLELLEEIDFHSSGVRYKNYKNLAELKGKMKELRRDTIKLEHEIKGYIYE